MRMAKIYYQDEWATIYHGDCREVLLELEPVDLVLTDPPYGVGLGRANNLAKSNGYGGHLSKQGYGTYADTYEEFIVEIIPRLNAFIDFADRAVVFSGPHIHEQKKPAAIGGIYHPAAAGRTPWGSKNFLPILFYGNPPSLVGTHRPTVFQSSANTEVNGHPCPKPIAWLKWLISTYALAADTILDPFMGSGTTLRAAKDLAIKSIGIEIEEKYCEIAVKRLRQEILFTEAA